MAYSIGFDGGGTKTECVILSPGGEAVGEGRGGPSNPLRSGYEAAFRAMSDAAAAALKGAYLRTGDISSVCAGLAGAGRREVVRRAMVFLTREFPRATTHVTTDLDVALESAVGGGAGIVLIAGTGSAAFGRNAEGRTARSGGYGPSIGDEGSAFDIGRRAVAAVARARDFDASETILTETIPAALDCSDWDDLLLRVAKNPDQIFPKLFPVVADAAASGDATANEILSRAATDLGNLALNVARRLNMGGQEFPLVKSGGVMGRCQILEGSLDTILATGVPRARISRLEISPAVGAARLAVRLAQSPAQSSTHGN